MANLTTSQKRAVRRIARAFKVSPEEILGDTRGTPKVALARQIVMLAMYDSIGSYSRVGHILGRDRTTVRHGCERAAKRIDIKALLKQIKL